MSTKAILDVLIPILITIESNGNDNAVGKHGEIGCLQLKKITVDDVNRINALAGNGKYYTYDDRYSREKSIEMCRTLLEYYGGYLERNSFLSIQNLALVWNMGYTAFRNKAPNAPYARKVNRLLREKETTKS